MKPFEQKSHEKPDLKRNSFDLSFTNNASFEFGKLYPVFCKEVIPGDSFNIEAALALNLQPMIFPVQTRMYANLHFFYCRNRAVWKDWKDFQFKTKDGLVPPFIKQSDYKFFQTGSLADYLGVPTTGDSAPITGSPFYTPYLFGNSKIPSLGQDGQFSPLFEEAQISTAVSSYFDKVPLPNRRTVYFFDGDGSLKAAERGYIRSGFTMLNYAIPVFYNLLDYDISSGYPEVYIPSNYFMCDSDSTGTTLSFVLTFALLRPDGSFIDARNVFSAYRDSINNGDFGGYEIEGDYNRYILRNTVIGDNTLFTNFMDGVRQAGFIAAIPCLVAGISSQDYVQYKSPYIMTAGIRNIAGFVFRSAAPDFPWLTPSGSEAPDLPISALPFRHYEAIYNTFYRNSRVDPFMKLNPDTGNFEPVYNEWNTTLDGGADTTYYDFFYRNWEDDFLTTSQLSPQQGIAPLVGVNSSGTFYFEDEQGNTSSLHAVTGPDGHTLTGIDAVSPNLPAGSLQQMMQMINHGISINDFRNVNSLQRWLEKNLRNGFKYRDLIRAHYGVDVHYNELDMPEFIGGVSDMITVNKVVNTNAADVNTPLGEFAGMASLFSQSKHSVNKWCDENGFIIGILSITPVPVYQSIIPKFYLKHDALDYFNEKFSKIGMQPIFQSEVAPIQAAAENKLTDLFGYQKAWYDYMASTDEAHGDMRDSLNDFIMMRKFSTAPELGHDFIKVDPDQLNNVFASTERNDKIYGSIYFQVYAKRPIPVNVVPALE